MKRGKLTRWPVAEVALGAGLALVAWLALHGVDVLPLLAMAGLFWILSTAPGVRAASRPRTLGGGTGQPPVPELSFDDIGGQEAAKRELKEALDFLIRRDEVERMGIRPLKGILLVGPPGTGKTLLARAAATYTGSAFVAASGSEFVEMYAGVGAARVRDLFRRARELARQQGKQSAIVFIDELEVLGGRRGLHTSHLEYDQTLNELLVQLDGIQGDQGIPVLVMGATNRPDLLDPALLRPGRFDRLVQVDLPDKEGRLSILKIHTRNKPLAPGVDLEAVARETFGFSGAQLEALANEAAILALREGKAAIEQRHLVEAVDKVILGERADRRPTPEEKRRVAVHEAGHALVGEWVEPGSVASVTVTPRGRAMGYVRHRPPADRYLYTRAMLEAQIKVALAGAVAEELVFGCRSTGARGDFDTAVHLAHQIIDAGLSDLGVVDPQTLDRSRQAEMVQRILQENEQAVRQYLAARRAALDRVVEVLLDREAMDGDTLRHILAEVPPAGDPPAGEAQAAPVEAEAPEAGAAPAAGAAPDAPSAGGAVDAPRAGGAPAPDPATA